ncbi:MAG: PQQ-binding-like beta-propeller repeat protein [Caldilineaceae bacterium]
MIPIGLLPCRLFGESTISCYNNPMSSSSDLPPRSRRPTTLLTASIVVGVVLLLGIGSLLWLAQQRFLIRPTPTPTATAGTPVTATPDFRATQLAEDVGTQIAYQATAQQLPPTGTKTAERALLPQVSAGDTSTATPVAGSQLPPAPSPIASPRNNTAILPIVSNGASPLPTPPPPVSPLLPPTPTLVAPVATATPLLTATPLPSPTTTPIPSPTPTIFSVPSLNGYIIHTPDAALRVGPSNLYSEAGRLAVNTNINLLGRDATGEWVYICCVNNKPYWVRQAYVQPRDNPTATAAPTDSNPNDVRWLPLQPLASSLEPLPAPATAVPADDFPLAQRDASHRARVPRVPPSPLNNGWPSPALAGGPFTTGAVVGGVNVLAMSADNQLYSFDRVDGHQRWRYLINFPVRRTPTVQDSNIYVVSDDGQQLFALVDAGNAANLVWQKRLPRKPTSGGVVGSNNAARLFISTLENNQAILYALNRNTGDVLQEKQLGTVALQTPTLGGQLVYVGGSSLWALDVENFEQAWVNTEIQNVAVPPLYPNNGVLALSELYVADNAGHVYGLDANTGVRLKTYSSGDGVTALAANNTTLFVAGPGYVKAITRDKDFKELWRVGINGQPLGGLLVDNDLVLVVTDTGDVQYLNPADGNSHHEAPLLQAPLSGNVAISGLYLFAPATNNYLYALRANQ